MNKFKLIACVFMLSAGPLTAQVQTDSLPAHFSQEEHMTDDPFARKWELSFHGGWSYRIAKLNEQVPPDFVDYAKRLRSGYHIGAGLDFFWRENMGVGLRYSRFGSREHEEYVTYTDIATGQVIGEGEMSDDIVVNFIAPAFNYRYIFPNRKAALQMHYAVGYLSYTNNPLFNGRYPVITARSFGVSLGADLVVPLGRRLAFSAGATLLGGNFGTLKVEYAGMTEIIKAKDNDERENVSRIDLSAGLRFKL
ncbi:hypothetical protein [Sphingobacterium haloxyli]|uniref:Outer membrane protein beta-barrel domain-containing protein n=1 Tax=Sphingobacterium haloxyli TaxID=2100533 RepID=A0A2S9J3B4_9SPHI|nr:hypothetical protein [Sphingobacterium haloxyli]PRD47249.1 hypothetical protein C5745_10485 [Sphingobacterium haloxyli]